MASSDDQDWYDGHPEKLPAQVRKLESNLSQDRFIDGAITRLYYGQGILPVGMVASQSTVPLASMFLRALDALVEENVLASVLDAAVSMIVRKPAFRVITSGGRWSKQVAARRLSRLLSGLEAPSGREGIRTPCVLDSMRCQVAAAKFVISPKGKAIWERCLPHTLIWNPAEGSAPRNIYERHSVPRARILRMYKSGQLKGDNGQVGVEKAIKNLPDYRPDPAFHIDTYSYTTDSDLVEVVEGHRKAEDDDLGKHVMMCGDLVLDNSDWDLPLWPIVPLTWGTGYDSLAGYPLGRRVLSFQRTIQRMDSTIDEAQSLACPPTLLVPKGAEVTGWSNKIGKRIDYVAAAGKPEILAGQALAPEYYNRFSQKKTAAYELSGVAQNIAQGTKEAGLNSGKAQRDRYDIANSRLVDYARNLEAWDAACARVEMAMLSRAYRDDKMRESAPNTALLNEIDWSAIDVKEDEVQVKAYITSAIPVEPQGRAETLAEWVQDGVITQKRSVRWYANPDTASIEDDESALEDLVTRMIDSALEDCEYMAPEPVMGPDGLGLCVQLGGQELMKALTMPQKPPEANVELLRRFIEEAKLLMASPGSPGDTSMPPAELAPPPGAPLPGLPGPGAPPPMPGGPPLPAPAPPS